NGAPPDATVAADMSSADAAMATSDVDLSAPPDLSGPTDSPPPFLPPTLQPFRAPAYPLITHDPYFSIWSESDLLAASWPAHWTGAAQGMASMVRIDGNPYRLMGYPGSTVLMLSQKSVYVTPTRTIYQFAGSGIELRLVFASPIIASDLELLGRPVSYVTWQARATDGQPHVV